MSKKRLIIVGAVAAGASAAAKARRVNEDIEIVLFESGSYMSFANCGLPYYVGGEIANRDSLFVANPDVFKKRFQIDIRLNTEVTAISTERQEVTFVNADGQGGTLGYDSLILATGTVPIIPPIEGLDGPHIFFCRTVPEVDAIMQRLSAILPHDMEGMRQIQDGPLHDMEGTGVHGLVIGGGYIGLECAEQLMHRGIHTTVIEAMPQVMGPLDPEMTQPIKMALRDSGATLILNDAVERIEQQGERSQAILRSGRRVVFDVAIIGTGVRPNVKLAQSIGVDLGKTGAIAVDAQQRTSVPGVYAAGDNSEAIFLPTNTPVNIPLAGPANKEGRIAGNNAALDLLKDTDKKEKHWLTMKGVLGTSIARVCGVVAGGTGLTEKVAKRLDISVKAAYVLGLNHAGYYPGAHLMILKVVYDPADGRLLGAQAVGQDGVDKRLDVLATAILGGMTVEDLENLDLCYAPPFGSAKDIAIMSGFITANSRRGLSEGVSPMTLFEELNSETPPVLIDVRTTREYADGHLETAINIPLDEIRERMNEIPKDQPVIIHCQTGYRSYVAQQILQNNGWTNIRNLCGGYAFASRVLSMDAV
ncbi:hypothetical protein CSA56_07445 [candidate division KSB3 bacterium]|uniref:Rhodanese domain-containing protein n=1 Tax=candidate division KSB3 bacterium TaxID=2044937 RepID=A0A2G6KFU5_9BACT|nr:MAG: hypothetical protein CSA56_07445 [candidate division KSB3 bacterium]